MISKVTAREENIGELVPLVGINSARHLQRIARSLRRLDECYCNYGLSLRQEYHMDRLEKEAARLAESEGYKVYRQGDPRGWPLYLYTEEQLTEYTQRIGFSGGIKSCYTEVGTAVCPY